MESRRIIVVGGGAAGIFAAIACAETLPGAEVTVLEKSPKFLAKVRISGGGRCNVTHACFDAREFATRYPRGGKELIGPLQRFSARDTVAWFAARGVQLKTEEDGRMFPITDSSQTIIDCLLSAAHSAGVKLRTNCGVEGVRRGSSGFEVVLSKASGARGVIANPFHEPTGARTPSSARCDTLPSRGRGVRAPAASRFSAPVRDFEIVEAFHESDSGTGVAPVRTETHRRDARATNPVPTVEDTPVQMFKARNSCSTNSPSDPLPFGKGVAASAGETIPCDRLLLASGGCRAVAAGELAQSLGHTLVPPVPSLFTFHIETGWLRELAGVSVESAAVSVPEAELCERGPVLVTHWGLSGPAILRLSAWGARKLHALDYKFPLLINWLPEFTVEKFAREFQARREDQGARLVINAPLAPLTARLWEALVIGSGIGRETRWAALTRGQQQQLVQQLMRTELAVTGKSLNKDEFVTCGGVRLAEMNFKTMESRICPGLYFAGELLDLDGLTGGFNFQAAWTTGWIAGRAMAAG